jgi:hypothetical protein
MKALTKSSESWYMLANLPRPAPRRPGRAHPWHCAQQLFRLRWDVSPEAGPLGRAGRGARAGDGRVALHDQRWAVDPLVALQPRVVRLGRRRERLRERE